MRPTLLALLLSTSLGCYRNEPLVSMPVPNQRIAITLTDSGTADLAATVGPSVVEIQGRLVTFADDSVRLRVGHTKNRSGIRVDWGGDAVSIPRRAIARIDAQVLDRQRTLLASVGAVVGAFAVWKGIEAIGTGAEPDDGGGPVDPALRVP